MFARESHISRKVAWFALPFSSLFGPLLALLFVANVQGQTSTPTPTATPTTSPTPMTPSLGDVKVTEVYKLGHIDDKNLDTRNSAALQEIIVVKVHDLQSLTRVAKCLNKDDRHVQNCHEQAIALFLDGRQIKGIVPESGAPRPEDETLQFHLQRNADSDETWADLLGAPTRDAFFKRPTEVAVGLENSYPLPTEVKVKAPDEMRRFSLIRIHSYWFVICSVLLGAVFVLVVLLAKYSELLRDLGPVPPADANLQANWLQKMKERKHKPYSLARFQMAFWFFLVITSFLFIWLVTGASDTITGSTLALIGIGAGTALGAATVDASKSQNNAEVGAKISNGFLNDILTDDANGVSFHRFQMFVWTLVLGILFIYSVWNRLSMPEFTATLLALMGISSGTYLGFKIPEKQT